MFNNDGARTFDPFLRLPQELRDMILCETLKPDFPPSTHIKIEWMGRPFRVIEDIASSLRLTPTNCSIKHPVQGVSKQVQAESVAVLRRLYSTYTFQLVGSDNRLIGDIVRALPAKLCNMIRTVTFDALAFEAMSWSYQGDTCNGEVPSITDITWTRNKNTLPVGQLMLSRLPFVRCVQLIIPFDVQIDRFTETQRFKLRSETYQDCARFFAGNLEGSRIDKLQFAIVRNLDDLDKEKCPFPEDLSFDYWAANEEPWNQFAVSKTFTRQHHEPRVFRSCFGRDNWLEVRIIGRWIVTYERMAKDTVAVKKGEDHIEETDNTAEDRTVEPRKDSTA
ncbi:hypothetical protein BT63DRAFT_454079 [Microthyrium microscopicum]|uniref:F-box domain-containing protein n=1 Tax=Microthyrium microscopicum TaxID=703497 RepID=A0A6A6UEI6_9PEZI|nr:hypothetical protein BT63DRAFT_454079 [Microthyrium microscopicum]